MGTYLQARVASEDCAAAAALLLHSSIVVVVTQITFRSFSVSQSFVVLWSPMIFFLALQVDADGICCSAGTTACTNSEAIPHAFSLFCADSHAVPVIGRTHDTFMENIPNTTRYHLCGNSSPCSCTRCCPQGCYVALGLPSRRTHCSLHDVCFCIYTARYSIGQSSSTEKLRHVCIAQATSYIHVHRS